jgi:NAD(P)-dependent dehydrogenase (short-subunit alcohol dehydrogenase family)
MEEFGRLDIVLSNSGIEHFGSVPTVTEAEMDEILRVDVKGQLFVTQHVQASSR